MVTSKTFEIMHNMLNVDKTNTEEIRISVFKNVEKINYHVFINVYLT
jgi:stress response protein YsnF